MKYNFDKLRDRTGTHAIKLDLRKQRFGNADVIPMWVADMDFDVLPEIKEAVKSRADHPIYGYTMRSDGYYDSIINWYKKRHNWHTDRKWFLFAPGVVPALGLCVLAYTNPGDKIIIQPPVYPPFFETIEMNKRQAVENPLIFDGQRYTFDFDQLKSCIDDKTKMIFLCNPHNPVGRAWSAEELRRLAEICIERNILIISDEIHCDLVLPASKHVITATLSEEIARNTITLFSGSKTFNLAGLSMASVIISNPKIYIKFKRLVDSMHLFMGNVFGAVAFESAFTHGEEWLEQLLQYIQGNFDYVMDFFEKESFEISMVKPEATYLGWMDFSKLGMNDKELKRFINRKAGIGFNDGSSFGKGGEGFQRINVATSRETVELAMSKLKKALNER